MSNLYAHITDVSNKLIENDRPLKMLIGLDGFVDEIIAVVDKRQDLLNYTRMNTISEFAERVSKAAGLSCNIEFAVLQTKLGGNGPIFANALLNAGAEVTYVGSVGEGSVHPVFSSITERADVYTVCAPGSTDALEFNDGKLMLGKHCSLGEVTWDNILCAVGGLQNFIEMVKHADLIGMENWTMLPHMSDIWEQMIEHVFPALPEKKSIAFFDLADPEKRTKPDILNALRLIARFENKFHTVLGLNEKELYEIADVCEIPHSNNLTEDLVRSVYKLLNITCLAVHPTKYAVACTKDGYFHTPGPYCDSPVLTTGAGDNFNAGFCLALSLGLCTHDALIAGVATSGFYVRNAKSPNRTELISFLEKWRIICEHSSSEVQAQ